MQYEFITNLSEQKYNSLIQDLNYIHYKSDNLWNKLNNTSSTIYVGLKLKRKYIACAKIEIKEHSLFISNLSTLNNDTIYIHIFLNEIKLLAKNLNLYEINILNIDFEDLNLSKKKTIHECSLISLQNNNKFLRKDYLKKLFRYDTSNLLFTKYKIDNNDLNNLKKMINIWNLKLDFDLNQLIKTYKNKCIINIEYLDLVYYLNQNKYHNINKDTINELIDIFGEDMIVGFSIILYPDNKKTAYCITLKTSDSFDFLNIKDNLIFESISITLKKKYHNLVFIDNINKGQKIYEFNYKIITNNFKNMIIKLKKRN